MESAPPPVFGPEYRERLEEQNYHQGLMLKEQGRLVIGVYCSYTPKELILAAGAIPVSLCAGSPRPIPDAEIHLPANMCPLIKSSYGFARTGRCRYFQETDLIVADATCDGKKKMFERLAEIRPVHLFHIPQSTEGPEHLAYFLDQLMILKDLLERSTGRPITDDDLRLQIRRKNRLREARLAVCRLNTRKPAVLTGRELDHLTFGDGFEWDLENRVMELNSARIQAEARASNGGLPPDLASRPRLLLTGCPTANRKMLGVIEDRGGLVAAAENCGGLKTIGPLVDETGDPLMALARRYIAIACPCMTPNRGRLDLIGRIAKEYQVDGVVDLTWEACQLYDTESFLIRDYVTERLRLPYLHLRTDYSESDHGQLGTRVEAFLEMIQSGAGS
jgi:benzoyl-CoA reductase/2-hydroxyglutaryl-CoA dehydratase subunit BcrC/BadD/HgdB